jgi:hypothetical protein
VNTSLLAGVTHMFAARLVNCHPFATKQQDAS